MGVSPKSAPEPRTGRPRRVRESGPEGVNFGRQPKEPAGTPDEPSGSYGAQGSCGAPRRVRASGPEGVNFGRQPKERAGTPDGPPGPSGAQEISRSRRTKMR